MKNKFVSLSAVILSLSMILSGCNNMNYKDDLTANNEMTVENNIIIGENNFCIDSAVCMLDDDDTEINLRSVDVGVYFEFDHQDTIPSGEFELSLDGLYTAEAMILGTDLDYDLTGLLSIEFINDSLCSLTASGNAFVDRASVPYSINYKGVILFKKD